MLLTHEHQTLYGTVKKFVEDELNPHIAEWERDGIWPAHEVLKKMAGLGLLGINKPEAFGGLGLDYSYEMIFAQALGNCKNGSLPMGIGVVTDMATPALSRFGPMRCAKNFSHRYSLASSAARLPSPKPAQAQTLPASRPARARTVTTTSSTARRCGSPTAPSPTGRAPW